MLGRLLLAGLVGGVIVFLLSAMQNTLLPAGAPRSLPDQASVLPVLRASISQDGFYFYPGDALTSGMTREQREVTQADYRVRFKAGPTGVLVYSRGGEDFHFGRRIAVQFILSLVAALIAAAILVVAAGSGTTIYATRAGIVVLLGFFAFVYLEPQYWNWYGFPASYTLARICGGVGTWAIAGMAMAAIVR
jgi:hypothetical protein